MVTNQQQTAQVRKALALALDAEQDAHAAWGYSRADDETQHAIRSLISAANRLRAAVEATLPPAEPEPAPCTGWALDDDGTITITADDGHQTRIPPGMAVELADACATSDATEEADRADPIPEAVAQQLALHRLVDHDPIENAIQVIESTSLSVRIYDGDELREELVALAAAALYLLEVNRA